MVRVTHKPDVELRNGTDSLLPPVGAMVKLDFRPLVLAEVCVSLELPGKPGEVTVEALGKGDLGEV